MLSCTTYVELPRDLVDLWLGPDVALEVDVVALLDGARVQRGAEGQANPGEI